MLVQEIEPCKQIFIFWPLRLRPKYIIIIYTETTVDGRKIQ